MGLVDNKHVPLTGEYVGMLRLDSVAAQILKRKEHHCPMLVSESVANGVRVSFKRIGIYEIEAFEILNAFYRLLPFVLHVGLARHNKYSPVPLV